MREECIKLSFPMNAAYVSSARLTASSIANRMSFDIDEIEDIKAAVSETCAFLLNALPAKVGNNIDITYYLKNNEIKILMAASGNLQTRNSDDMSLIMIKALVDEFDMSSDTKNEIVTVTMVKRHTASIFE